MARNELGWKNEESHHLVTRHVMVLLRLFSQRNFARKRMEAVEGRTRWVSLWKAWIS